ncbi:MAG: CapA family protein, partial [Bacteroidales bacterium]|nr:CapA family protein [Bacteroidales bacterium]
LAQQTTKATSVSFAFTGDVMMGTNFPENYITPDRGKTLFKNCKELLKSADLAIINMEGTCYEGTDGELRQMTNPNTYYIFRSPGDHAQHLSDAGIDIVNFANNHSYDFGQTGREKTIQTLRGVGVELSGIRELAEGCVLERKGLKIGYVSFAASCTKVNDMLNDEEVERLVKKYRGLCDILVVGFHGGAEGVAAANIPMKTEYYVGENRGDVVKFAHKCIDLGADIVVGHGPHVPRAMELYKGHLIAYSLGNFCTPYRMGNKGMCGHAPLLYVTLNANDGTLKNGNIHSFLQHNGSGPTVDSLHLAAKDIRRLTIEDFPNAGIEISEKGEDALMQALEAGAEDATEEDESIIIYTTSSDLMKVKKALEEAGLTVTSAELQYVPTTYVPVEGDNAEKLEKLLSNIDDLDDVVNVYTNAE